ncbi:MAG TPA: hypothetical protein PLN56_08315 [Methanoregulaceae archaeon]|nr:MAG: hypothetical protein IPI71_08040 [Methanolinea sp.]HON82241.1 hypothetical protein [Methanoregulaceae archaeon]HPD10986.1 hypothetical protein [Methanoregulaceae archaeon]HRT15197.1 hypothetical protein [Methanoregulaceae archaeon]HRU30686.1 hypothetical protein [Methanoregulaceae archaeon]
MARTCGDIDRYIGDTSFLSTHERRELDRKNFYASAMVLFPLMNAVIGLACDPVPARNAGRPSTHREIFTLLVQAPVIDTRESRADVPPWSRKRYRLKQEHGAIDPCYLVDTLDMTETIRIFVERKKRTVPGGDVPETGGLLKVISGVFPENSQ